MANFRYLQTLIVSVIALQGCGHFLAATPTDVRDSNGEKATFTVPVEFDDAVNNIFYASENCGNTREMPVGHFASRRSRDNENSTATAVWGYDGPSGFNTFQVVDLIRHQHETEVRVSMKEGWILTKRGLDRFAERVHQWVLGSTSCLGM